MNELTPFHDVHFLETVLDEVLYSLYVVVGDLLDFLHLGRILRSHVPVDVPEGFVFRAVEIGQLRKRDFAECDEIFYLDADTVLDESVFAEIFSEGFGLTRVASVDRRYCQ